MFLNRICCSSAQDNPCAFVYARSRIAGANGYWTVPPYPFFCCWILECESFPFEEVGWSRTWPFLTCILRPLSEKYHWQSDILETDLIQHKCDDKNGKFDRKASTSSFTWTEIIWVSVIHGMATSLVTLAGFSMNVAPVSWGIHIIAGALATYTCAYRDRVRSLGNYA